MRRKIFFLFLALAACVGMSAQDEPVIYGSIEDALCHLIRVDDGFEIESSIEVGGESFAGGYTYTLKKISKNSIENINLDGAADYYYVFQYQIEENTYYHFNNANSTLLPATGSSEGVKIGINEDESNVYDISIYDLDNDQTGCPGAGIGGDPGEGGGDEPGEENNGPHVGIWMNSSGDICYTEKDVVTLSVGTGIENYALWDGAEEEFIYGNFGNTHNGAGDKEQGRIAVTAQEGFNITKVVFITDNGDIEDSEAPYEVYIWNQGVYSSVEAMEDPENADGRKAITDINVYYETVAGYNNISSNQDPEHEGDFYTTFFDEENNYLLPSNVEAYVATLGTDVLNLTKVAEAGDVLPANTPVIFKAAKSKIPLQVSEALPVSVTATNNLHGTHYGLSEDDVPENCYVLSGRAVDEMEDVSETGLGFYPLASGRAIPAHKAYLQISGGAAYAPRRLRFVFEQEQTATGIDNANANVKAEKLIENGVLYIIKNNVRYNAQGQIVK